MTEMQFCPFCGTAWTAGAQFCVSCGKTPNVAPVAAQPAPAPVAVPAPPVAIAPAPQPAVGAPWAQPAAAASLPPTTAPQPPMGQPFARPAAPPPQFVRVAAPGVTAYRTRPAFMGDRPNGVVVVALLAAVFAVLLVINGANALQTANRLNEWYGSGFEKWQFLAMTAVGLGIAAGIAAYGLWTSKPWAWMLAGVVAGVDALLELWGLVDGGVVWIGVVLIVCDVAVLYYLNTPEVRVAFGRPASGFGLQGRR